MRARRIGLAFLAAVSSVFLSGCFAGRLRCEVHPDGSSDLRLGLGIDTELAHLTGVGGRNWFEELGVEVDAEIQKEVADGMNWQYTDLKLKTLEELQEKINEMDWGEASIAKQNGILFDTFEFRVKGTEPLFDEEDAAKFESELVEFDPAGYVDLTWELILPGEVLEHNGSHFDPETNLITWYPDASESLTIYARSRVFNAWVIPVALVVLLAGLAIGAGIVVLAVIYLSRDRRRA